MVLCAGGGNSRVAHRDVHVGEVSQVTAGQAGRAACAVLLREGDPDALGGRVNFDSNGSVVTWSVGVGI